MANLTQLTFFLTCGADINSRDISGCTALSYAIQESHTTAKILIERGCEVKLRDMEGNCVDDGILESAAYKGFKDILQLLHDRGVPLDAVNRSGKTPLMTAAEAGKCDVMAFLLDQGANINGLDSVNDVKEVTANRTDHDESDCRKENSDLNRTPLYCALEAGQGEAAKLLIERGCLSSNSDGETNSLAELAAMHGLKDVFELLADKKSFPFDKIKDGETLLTSAANRGDFDSVKFLLQNGANVNAKNSLGDTALSCAVQFLGSSTTEIVKLLLESGADMNTRNERCETRLLLATKMNAEKVVALLLELRCETNVSNVCSLSPLHYAAENNNGRLTEKLLQYGADPSVKEDDEGMTPLHVAANSGSVLAAEVLLEHGVRTNLGETPLVIAARRGNVSIGMVQFLLQKGSNVRAKDTSGMTPLTNAVIDYRGVKSFSVVKKLLNLGSCVNDVENFGRSVLHYIPSNAERKLFDLLLHYGGNVSLPDKNGETPLHLAGSTGNTSYIEWLIEQGADVGALDRENRTPLHAAAYEHSNDSVELLIQNGAEVSVTDDHGWLPLHFAVARGRSTTLELLLLNGSDITAVDNKGRTVLHLAAKYGWLGLADHLIGLSCTINAKDFGGQTVFGASLECKFSYTSLNFVPQFLRLFLENGGDVRAVDLLTGRTTLHVAAADYLVDTVVSKICLQDQGLDIEARDKNGDTPLHRAAARGTPEVIQRLVDRGADLSTINNRDQTPLMVSLAANTSLEGPKILLQSGSNVHAADQRGNTVLHYAVRWNDCSLLNEIIELGGDVNAVNIHGYTPLHQVACESFSPLSADTIKILLKAGVGVDCQDKLGNTPLHIAIA